MCYLTYFNLISHSLLRVFKMKTPCLEVVESRFVVIVLNPRSSVSGCKQAALRNLLEMWILRSSIHLLNQSLALRRAQPFLFVGSCNCNGQREFPPTGSLAEWKWARQTKDLNPDLPRGWQKPNCWAIYLPLPGRWSQAGQLSFLIWDTGISKKGKSLSQ